MGDSLFDDFLEVAGAAVIGAVTGLIATTVIVSSPILVVGSLLALGCCIAYAFLTRENLVEFKNSPEVKSALENKLRGKRLSTHHLSGRITHVKETNDGKKCVTVEIKADGHRATHTAKIGADEISDEIYVGASF